MDTVGGDQDWSLAVLVMSISVKAIPTGHRLYIYKNGSYENRDHIDTVALLSPTNIIPTDCVCHFVKGTLDNEINLKIAKTAVDLGYTRMWMTRPEGHKASRWAQYVETWEGLDVYLADLVGIIEQVGG